VARQRPLHQQRDNDLHLGRLDSSSDGLRANTTAERPSFTSPHGGREPAIKAKEPEAPSAGGTYGLIDGGNRFGRGSLTYGDHHLTTNDSGHLPTNTAPATAATCARYDRRPDGGRTAAPWPGSSSSPSPAWLEDASSAELEDALLPRSLEEEAGHRPTRGRPQLGALSSPARMMNILEAEGGAEAATRLASPHHKAGDHPYG
jgi:hypothetical protein